MSYQLDMMFVPAKNQAEAFEKALAYTESIGLRSEKGRYIKQLVKENSFYVPSSRFSKPETDKQAYLLKLVDRYWLHMLLTLDFAYWPEFEVLGLTGGCWPKTTASFNVSIYFQNSCDQNYDLETWNGIPFFEKTRQELMMKPDDFFYDEVYDLSLEEFLKNQEAVMDRRKTIVYETIFDKLCLDDLMWDKESPCFRRFSLSVLNNSDEQMEAYRISLMGKI